MGSIGALSHEASERALRPVETGSGVLVHSSADRRLAAEQWLLSTHPAPSQARMEWTKAGVALLPLGTLFSAVRLPGRLIAAAVGSTEDDAIGGLLEEALDGGPVICDPHGHRYYALVPGSMPARWTVAAEEWRPLDIACLGRGTYLGVPRLDHIDHDPETYASYWSVPMHSAASLCEPLHVARLIAVGSSRLRRDAAE